MIYISFDPYKQIENGRFNCLSATELSDTIKRLYAGWQNWRLTSADNKIELLRSLGNLLLSQKNRHAVLITSEMGKPVNQAEAEIEKCASLCFYYGEHLKEFNAPEKRSSSARESYVFYEPQGIILGIMPWNFPYWQAMRFIIPVISGGNAVLLKHSSNVPVCAGNIESVIREAGFPVDLFRNIFVSYDQIESILEQPEVKGVSVTGSNKAGKKIAEIAGKNLKKIVLELGGSDPFIVLKDADLNAATEAAVFSRFQNCGQSCIAAKRIFVHKYIFDSFLSLMEEKVRALKIGDPSDPDTFIGPMVSEHALDELHEQIVRTLSMGALAITGATRYTTGRPIYNPTLLVNVPEDSPLICEEVFGPAIPVMEFTDIEEVIKRANSSSYGLGASLWTGNIKMAMMIASKIEAGNVSVNGFVRSDPALPFGGVKESGYGRELSVEGFREFLNIKTVSIF
jgi:succinate-semialdehyde dehydrogenase/glutarate-semialdehyde dehydrogenase